MEVRRWTVLMNANYRELTVNWRRKYISTDDKDGGQQADCFDERELPQIKRELKEICPQADDGGKQLSINDDWWWVIEVFVD